MKIDLDTSDPGKAADVMARAMILFALTCGKNAENEIRRRGDFALAYPSQSFEDDVIDLFPELSVNP